MSVRNALLGFATLALLLAGCQSGSVKTRKEAREKMLQTSHMYCDFVNGEIYADVEVQLNLEMAKRCDANKNFSITSYKTPSENAGIVYCCSLAGDRKAPVAKTIESSKPAATSATPAATAAPAAKADEFAEFMNPEDAATGSANAPSAADKNLPAKKPAR